MEKQVTNLTMVILNDGAGKPPSMFERRPRPLTSPAPSRLAKLLYIRFKSQPRNRLTYFAVFIVLVSLLLLLTLYCSAKALPGLRIVPDQYPTVGDALASSRVWDVIYVRSGIYGESIVIDKPVILIGEDPQKTWIDGGSSEYTIMVKSSNVLITGFTVTGGGVAAGFAGRGAGLEIYGSSSVIVTGNRFTGNRMAIYVDSSSRVIISGNEVHGNREGIYATGSNSTIISRNILADNQEFGIQLAFSHNNRVSWNIIQGGHRGIILYEASDGNEVTGNILTGSGITLIESHCNLVSGNTFNDAGIFISSSYGNEVSGNMINGRPIIYLEGEDDGIIEEAGQVILVKCRNMTLIGVEVRGAGVGMELWESDHVRILEGGMIGNGIAVYIHASNNSEISGNLIKSNSIGILASNSCGNVIKGNEIDSNMYGIALANTSGNMISGNTITRNTNAGILIINSTGDAIHENHLKDNSRDIIAVIQTV